MATTDSKAYDTDMARQTAQAKMLREAREKLGTTSEGLADLLGVEPSTMNCWLLPAGAKAHRNMTKTARLLLQYVLADKRHAKK